MNLFIQEHQDLIKTLIDAKVDFIVIGGYSVIFHGYDRTTGDVDIWLKPDNANKAKVAAALEQYGIDENGISNVMSLDFTETVAFNIGHAPERADFITRINLVKFEDADKQKVISEVDGLQVPFLHLNDLILSTMNTGRLQDMADIEKLQQVQKARNKKQ